MYEEVLVDWNYWGNYDIEYIDREYSLNDLIGHGKALVLYGVRRAGKSYLAYGYLKKQIEEGLDPRETLIVNLEDPRLTGIGVRDLLKIYEEYVRLMGPRDPIIVLDEVQVVDGWEKFVRYLVENKRHRVIVTGSSSKLMSAEYASVLTGRHVDLEVFPLSFHEYLYFRGLDVKSRVDLYKHRLRVNSLLEEYLDYGGFPEIALEENPRRRRLILHTYFNDILVKDVATRYRIRDYRLLESIAKIYITNIARPLSMRSIARTLNKPIQTIEKYTEYLGVARLFIYLKKISRSAKEVEKTPRKIYVIDIGLYNEVSLRRDYSKILENIVFLHLARMYRENKELFYYKTQNNREVDFAVKINNRIEKLVQVTYELRPEDNEQYRREVGALARAARETGCRKLEIVTWMQEDTIIHDNLVINVKPLWKWLLEPSLG